MPSTHLPSSAISIAKLGFDQMESWLDANMLSRGVTHMRRLLDFCQDAEDGKRMIWAAWHNGEFLGHITLQYGSEYPPFHRSGIFEIVDLWVEPEAREHGVGRQLLKNAMAHAAEKGAPHVGMGVGVTSDFGAAHCLYASEGFAPDGTGLWVHGKKAREGDTVTLEDGVIMMWVKSL